MTSTKPLDPVALKLACIAADKLFNQGRPLGQIVESAIRAYEAAKWKDIKDAPKNEKYVLLSGPDGIDIGLYDTLEQWSRFETAEYDNEFREIKTPTHYQELPTPPEADHG